MNLFFSSEYLNTWHVELPKHLHHPTLEITLSGALQFQAGKVQKNNEKYKFGYPPLWLILFKIYNN